MTDDAAPGGRDAGATGASGGHEAGDAHPTRAWDGRSWDGRAYREQVSARAAAAGNPHGEADLVTHLGATTVLDAGCGTGRVAIELARREVEVVGVDVDASMLEVARTDAPDGTWIWADLARLDLGRVFDLVLLAGNVPLFLPAGTSAAAVVDGCARHLGPGGMLLTGFALGRGYDLAAFDLDADLAGLDLADRWATWDRAPFVRSGATYAVSLHHRPS